MKYDIIIVGAGPAGLTAALYACRAEKKVLVIEKNTFGGQITHSPRVENYPGFAEMSGTEFADKMVSQVLAQGADIELDCVEEITGQFGNFVVKCASNVFVGKTVILATGSHHRTLGLPKEEKFTGSGISYCAVCDGAFYKGKDVVVVGGGNSALQEIVMLSDLCKSVTVVQDLPFLTGEQRLINEIEKRENVSVRLNTSVVAILGDTEFEGVRVKVGGITDEIYVDGMFIAIGQQPENEPFVNVASIDANGYLISDESCVVNKNAGIFAAGDCRTKKIRQITTATADGAVAAIAACKML